MNSRNAFLFVILSFFSAIQADVSFSKAKALVQKKNIENLVSQTKVRSKVATGALAVAGLVATRYYFPGLFPDLPFWKHKENLIKTAYAENLSKDVLAQIKALPKFTSEQVDILKQLADQHAEALGKKNILHKSWDLVKSLAPFVVAQPVFGYIDDCRKGVVRACYPNITLSWFIVTQTRFPHFGILFEEDIKLLQQEREKDKIDSLTLLTQDAFECFVQHTGPVVGYMYWRAQETEEENVFMSSKLHNIAENACSSLESLCKDMNILLASREAHIGVPGRFESFRDEFDQLRKTFMIYENEALSPSMQEKTSVEAA